MTATMRGAPHDEDAEAACLGGATIWPTNVPSLVHTLTSADFYLPRHQRWFAALKCLHDRGEAIEPVGVGYEMQRLGEDEPGFMTAALATVADRNIGTPMRLVAEHALRRRLLVEAGELARAAADVTMDPGEVLDATRASLVALETPLAGREPDDVSVEEFLAHGLDAPTPWVIPAILRQGWRTVVVAREGQGKTWLLRQMAVCAAYGIHPLRTTKRMPPVRTLLVDLENPDDHLHYSLQRLVTQAKRDVDTVPEQRLWRRPGGINLRRRADRTEMEALLTRRRPELLVIGPLYKTYRANSRDSWDLVASEVQEILDDWRARFDLTMLIEDHAPKGSDLVPFGSSLWLRWPEVGLALNPAKHERLDVSRWRGDRMPTDWPDQLSRGLIWPWEGIWPGGPIDDGTQEF